MDAYSNIVTTAVETAKNAVVKIDCFKQEKEKPFHPVPAPDLFFRVTDIFSPTVMSTAG